MTPPEQSVCDRPPFGWTCSRPEGHDGAARPTTQAQNERGEWVPAIPLPFYGLRKRCTACGDKFWTTEGYRGHYALVHALALGGKRS